MAKEPVGVFVKDGREQTAYTPAAAVQLRAQGWLPKPEAEPATFVGYDKGGQWPDQPSAAGEKKAVHSRKRGQDREASE